MIRQQQGQRCAFTRADPFEQIIRYMLGLARASGSPETSLLNTFDNMFVAYYAIRLLWKSPGTRYTSLEAWKWVTEKGIFGGDDGVVADIPEWALTKAAEQLGLNVKPVSIVRGDPFVNFLARFYTRDLWNGNPTSCCDVKRQLAKLHMANGRTDVTPKQKLKDKLIGYALSDANTPIIGKFATKGLKLLDSVKTAGVYQSWSTQGESQYPNEFHEDFDDLVEMQIPTFHRDAYEDWVDILSDADTMLVAPSFMGEIMPLANSLPGVQNNIDTAQEPPEPPSASSSELPSASSSGPVVGPSGPALPLPATPKPPPGKPPLGQGGHSALGANNNKGGKSAPARSVKPKSRTKGQSRASRKPSQG